MDGKVLGRYYTENRSDARFENLPPHLVDALISTEDARFYTTPASTIGLARAVPSWASVAVGRRSQQLAKLLFTDQYETTSFFERAVLQSPGVDHRLRLERHYTKQEIIALYFNRYDFINQAVGIESAANVYFNKPASDLNVQESAMLVGMLKNSALYSAAPVGAKPPKCRVVPNGQIRAPRRRLLQILCRRSRWVCSFNG